MLAKKKKTPQPLGPMLLNICGVKREMMKFWMMDGLVSTAGGFDGIRWVGVRNLPKTNY